MSAYLYLLCLLLLFVFVFLLFALLYCFIYFALWVVSTTPISLYKFAQ